jgi:hypothetical protein
MFRIIALPVDILHCKTRSARIKAIGQVKKRI